MSADDPIKQSLWADITDNRYAMATYLMMVVAVVVILQMQGRVWWCQAGDMVPWAWNIWSTHNSQHIIDPYSFTHVLHGVIEFWLIGFVFRRMPIVWRLALAIFIESSWEVAENSTMVIERYRAATISLDYFGDSIINSIADIACCATGFVIAYKLKFWRSLLLFLTTEALLIVFIKDSLVINIIMLLFPIDAIKNWQMSP
ncbi:MAG TPA: DUF2585 family protein [Pyrinomonadaceae bacterium]|jgi:hypothetical protein|nr:DUF2585 family protein [Pyrinomonadaceae bacterium]HQX54969.1 DUF2585 family protein [Pyrinomonadaceae bacterium]HQY66701.1 DUF2585 family protein [Pyrinomonadaceae bacterium]HRA39844.1 DUF2585 family protein [Pyrinomonadaceae bacterium]